MFAVGGIKEKVLGAHRAGIREVVLPFENEADVEDFTKRSSKRYENIFC